MKTEIENQTPVYELIPMSEIDIEARKIAVAWVERYGTMGFDIQNKHKLASDIMNYHRQKVAESKTDIVDEDAYYDALRVAMGYSEGKIVVGDVISERINELKSKFSITRKQ